MEQDCIALEFRTGRQDKSIKIFYPNEQASKLTRTLLLTQRLCLCRVFVHSPVTPGDAVLCRSALRAGRDGLI